MDKASPNLPNPEISGRDKLSEGGGRERQEKIVI
jgi:hypothetical protein